MLCESYKIQFLFDVFEDVIKICFMKMEYDTGNEFLSKVLSCVIFQC